MDANHLLSRRLTYRRLRTSAGLVFARATAGLLAAALGLATLCLPGELWPADTSEAAGAVRMLSETRSGAALVLALGLLMLSSGLLPLLRRPGLAVSVMLYLAYALTAVCSVWING